MLYDLISNEMHILNSNDLELVVNKKLRRMVKYSLGFI